MKIKSTYLNTELDIPQKEYESAGENVTIISHKTLEDLVYNSVEAKAENIQAHQTLLSSEPGHYVFLCAINDKNGRRVEGLGESQASTLLTKIAQDYPATMAFNRAFDSAAIKFFGFPSKVYSDLQIEPGSSPAPAPVTETKGKADAKKEPKKGTAAKADAAGISAEVTPEEPPKESAAAPAEDVSLGDTSDNGKPFPAKENKPKTAPAKETPAPAAVVPDAPDAEDGDEFDKTIITVGSMKREGLSVRACYERKPEAIRWIAYTLSGKSELYKAQKDVCARFLQSIGDTEGMENAS